MRMLVQICQTLDRVPEEVRDGGLLHSTPGDRQAALQARVTSWAAYLPHKLKHDPWPSAVPPPAHTGWHLIFRIIHRWPAAPATPHPPLLQRFLFMKLMYHDHAPEEYEPPFFVGMEDGGGAGHFSRKPFTMCVHMRACPPALPACRPACLPACLPVPAT